jgi:hypothetical protein
LFAEKNGLSFKKGETIKVVKVQDGTYFGQLGKKKQGW